jgi:hypothetical protein
MQLQCMNVDNILPFCSPAPYGDIMTESTKLDPSVRRASEAWCDVALDYEYKPESESSPFYGRCYRTSDSYPIVSLRLVDCCLCPQELTNKRSCLCCFFAFVIAGLLSLKAQSRDYVM